MLSIDKFKSQLASDWLKFCSKINIFESFNVSRLILFCVILLIFPYLILFWFFLICYKYLFLYFFLILDIFFIDVLYKSKFIGNIYNSIKNIFFILLYNPLFVYLPLCYKLIISYIAMFNLSNILKYTGRFIKQGCLFIFAPVIKCINLLIEFDFSFSLFWSSWWDRYQRSQERRFYQRQKRIITKFAENQKWQKIKAMDRIKRRAALQLKILDLKLWYLTNLAACTIYWYKACAKFYFVNAFILRIYLYCKYIWLFRQAYYIAYRRFIIFKTKVLFNNLIISLSYYYNSSLQFYNFKPKLFILYCKYIWISLKILISDVFIGLVLIFFKSVSLFFIIGSYFI